MSEQPSHDEELRDLAISHARMRRIEAARETASQITDHQFQRSAWMGILYSQFFDSTDLTEAKVRDSLGDLAAVKETLSLLSDASLWYGSWVPELLQTLVRAGDSAGAIEIASKIREPFHRGSHYGDIAADQAMDDNREGTEQTLVLLASDPERVLSQDMDMLDIALGKVARRFAWKRGDIEQARQYANRIKGDMERKKILARLQQPSP